VYQIQTNQSNQKRSAGSQKGGADVEALRRIKRLKISGNKNDLTNDLQFMAEYKYDSYEIYSPVKKFLPSLLEWLTKFQSQKERETALLLIRKLLFVSRKEILELSQITYQSILRELLEEIVRVENLDPFDYSTAFRKLRPFIRKNCVFIAMSDGAQIDYFRRHSNKLIENDQVVSYYKLDEQEIRKFRKAKYAFLVDDMCGSGKTFLRVETNGRRRSVTGQLPRFNRIWGSTVHFKAVYYCPYLMADKGRRYLEQSIDGPRRLKIPGPKLPQLKFLYGMAIPQDYSILSSKNKLFRRKERLQLVQLCKKYYDKGVENPATMKGGGCKFGFGQGGVFLVRYNNTPNNTPSILWYSSTENALFKRLVRHRK
jgi:hypothetical protein